MQDPDTTAAWLSAILAAGVVAGFITLIRWLRAEDRRGRRELAAWFRARGGRGEVDVDSRLLLRAEAPYQEGHLEVRVQYEFLDPVLSQEVTYLCWSPKSDRDVQLEQAFLPVRYESLFPDLEAFGEPWTDPPPLVQHYFTPRRAPGVSSVEIAQAVAEATRSHHMRQPLPRLRSSGNAPPMSTNLAILLASGAVEVRLYWAGNGLPMFESLLELLDEVREKQVLIG